jgi:hypothetical protein
MVFRGLQAAGSAATKAIGSGVVSDIATPCERGAFVGINSGSKQGLVTFLNPMLTQSQSA